MQEDLEKSEFARLQQRVIQERQKLEELQSKLSEMLNQARQNRKGKGNIQNFIQVREYAGILEKQIAAQEKELKEWKEKLEQQREKLIEASQDRQAMENLKENEFEEFQEEQRKQEQDLNNEIATRQHYKQYQEEQG